MSFLPRLFNQAEKDGTASGLPVNWKQTLRRSNVFMARRAIADFFHIANQQAEAEGKRVIWKKEIVDAWEQFSLNPSYETVVQFLTVMPNMFPYFDSLFQQSLYPAI